MEITSEIQTFSVFLVLYFALLRQMTLKGNVFSGQSPSVMAFFFLLHNSTKFTNNSLLEYQI